MQVTSITKNKSSIPVSYQKSFEINDFSSADASEA